MARRRLEIEIAADTTKLNRGLRQADSSLRNFGRTAGKRVGGGRGGVLADALGFSRGNLIATAAIGAVGLATVALKGSVRAAKEAQEAQAGLRQALGASGISWAKNQRQIEQAIQSTSKIAGIDDEEVSRSFANLVRTTGSVAKATRDVALAANIARARHISLAAATKIVEKAEIGQFRGLKTIGIQLGKNVTATEAITTAQKKFAGSSEAFGRTAAGAQAKLGVAFENLQERLGAKLIPLLTRVSLALVNLIDFSEKNWPRFARAVQSAYKTVRPLIESLKVTIKGVANVLIGTVKVIEGIAHGDWSKVWEGLKQTAIRGIGAIVLEMVKLPVRILAALGRAAFRGLEKIGGWIKDAVLDGLKGLADAVAGAITAALDKALEPVRAAISGANKAIGTLNKFSPFPDVPKIPSLGHVAGANTPTGNVFAAAGRGLSGTGIQAGGTLFQAGGAATTIIVPVNLDGHQIARVVTSHQNRSGRHNAGSFTGKTPGFNPGTA